MSVIRSTTCSKVTKKCVPCIVTIAESVVDGTLHKLHICAKARGPDLYRKMALKVFRIIGTCCPFVAVCIMNSIS